MKLFKKFCLFFNWGPDDWRVVWNSRAETLYTDIQITHHYFYVIKYSEFRDKFKLICSGESLLGGNDAKKHSYYNAALSKLSEYNNELLEIRFRSKSKSNSL